MQLIAFNNADRVPFDLDGRIVFSSEKLELVHLSLNKGEEIEPHANPFDVVFFFIEGEGEVLYEDQRTKVQANTTVFIEKGKMRGVCNTGDTRLRILVSKIF